MVCSVDSNTLNVCPGGRGFSGTAAAPHGIGLAVRNTITTHHHNQLAAEVKAIEEALGPNLSNVASSWDNISGKPTTFPPSAHASAHAPAAATRERVSAAHGRNDHSRHAAALTFQVGPTGQGRLFSAIPGKPDGWTSPKRLCRPGGKGRRAAGANILDSIPLVGNSCRCGGRQPDCFTTPRLEQHRRRQHPAAH